jgi:heme/copper-type cytochrome/quinol oxidase subunit 3
MGDVRPLQPKPEAGDRNARAGMLIALGAWGMMFGGLFFSFVFVRLQPGPWPPPELPDVPLRWLWGASVGLVLCSALLEGGRSAIRRARPTMLAGLWLGAGLFAVGFLALAGTFFVQSRALGLSGAFGSLFQTFLLFHALSVLVGLPALGVIARRALAGRYAPQRHLGVRLWAGYWHLLAAVWLLMVGIGWWV